MRVHAGSTYPRLGGSGGWTLTELVVGTFVATLLLGGAVLLLQQSARLVETVVAREEAAETLRTTWTVLGEEVSVGVRDRDWALDPATDRAILLRAFRGLSVPCLWASGSREGTVVWRGHRAPDPDRDSVLILEVDGRWRGAALERTDTSPDACDAPLEGRRERWRLSEAPSEPILFRFFERGRYSLEEGAFRYRRGGEGRQPLTPERVGGESVFGIAGRGDLEVTLDLHPGGMVHWRIPSIDPSGSWGSGSTPDGEGP